jgi:hypothetical protein
LALGALLSLAWMSEITLVRANGRFPAAQQLVVHPHDPNRLWLRTTYGLLTSSDRGKAWRWVCEQAIGYGGNDDPAVAVTGSGSLLAGVFQGLSITSDNGCSFSFQPTIGIKNVADVSVEKRSPERALALASTSDAMGGFSTNVWRTTDSGATWTKLGGDLDPTLLALTIDSAPSDRSTIYVTGARYFPSDGGSAASTRGVLYRTTDDGQSWVSLDVPGTDTRYQPYLSAIDPNDSRKLYIRVRGPDVYDQPGTFVQNWLLYSEDGGGTFRELLRENADFLGFALASDGQSVFIGMGDSYAPGFVRPGNEAVFGLYRASISNFAFERVVHARSVPSGHTSCLTFDGDELWVCGSDAKQGFMLARSNDRGTTLEPVSHLVDLEGPLPCGCESSTGRQCPSLWPTTCSLIGRCGVNNPGSARCGDAAPAPADAGKSSASRGAESSCACRAPAAPSGSKALLFALASLWAARAARARLRETG